MTSELVVSTEYQKAVNRFVCGGADIHVNDSYCAQNPHPIDFSEFSHMRLYLPSWLADDQVQLKFCLDHNRWYAGEVLEEAKEGDREGKYVISLPKEEDAKKTCKANDANCGGVDPATARKVYDECHDEIIKYFIKADDAKTWVWGICTAVLVAILGIAWFFAKKLWATPDIIKDAANDALKLATQIRESKGLRAKVMAFLRGSVNIIRVLTGKESRDKVKNEQKVAALVHDKWPEVRAKLTAASASLNLLLDGLDESLFPKKFEFIRAANLGDIIGTDERPDAAALAQRLFSNRDRLIAYQKATRVLEEVFTAMISGQALPTDVIPSQDVVQRVLAQSRQFRTALHDFMAANEALMEIAMPLASIYPSNVETSSDWLRKLATTKFLEKDHVRMVSFMGDVAEVMLADLANGNEFGVRDLLERFHGISALQGLISRLADAHRQKAALVGVKILAQTELPPFNIPHEKQVPLFQILCALMDNAIDYSDPKRRGRDAVVELSCSIDGDSDVSISVADNGVGIKNISGAFSGHRERPDLAPGLGMSLREANQIAGRFGLGIMHRQRRSGTEFVVSTRPVPRAPGIRTVAGNTVTTAATHTARVMPPPTSSPMAILGGLALVNPLGGTTLSMAPMPIGLATPLTATRS
jgi:signal transduction histidine kinase